MSVKRLYHGTIYYFDQVDVQKGKGYKDFGKGFYTTGDKHHAESIARRNRRIEIEKLRMKRLSTVEVHAYLYEFNFEMDLIKTCNSKVFPKQVDLDWIDFILANRACAIKAHTYDIVVGATADDDTKNALRIYRTGGYGTVGTEKAKRQLLSVLETDKLSRQIYFGNQYIANSLALTKRGLII